MSSLAKWIRGVVGKPPHRPARFPTTGFPVVRDARILEEERYDEFKGGQYYPVNIGDIYDSKYQVLGKLGFGTTSTVWLARNLWDNKHVTLKVYTRDGGNRDEFRAYEALGNGDRSHQGHRHVRTALDMFELDRRKEPVVDGRNGGEHAEAQTLTQTQTQTHHCLVQKPMWDTWHDFLRRNPAGVFDEELLKLALGQLLLGLDYLHSECKLVHTDIKADNVHHELVDEDLFEHFTRSEMTSPSPRKFVNGVPVYASRRFGEPKTFGRVVLGDFGAAVRGDETRSHSAQPNIYKSPEVLLKADWSYPIDIWNVGVMTWDLFEGRHLFHGYDPKRPGYSPRAHVAELVALLGPPPLDLVQRGRRSSEFFFAEDARLKDDVPVPRGQSLADSVTRLEGERKQAFLSFIAGMLQWRPEDRKTAKQLLDDPWLWS